MKEDRMDHFEEDMEHLISVENGCFEEDMEKCMDAPAKEAASDAEACESMEGEAISRKTGSSREVAVTNSCRMRAGAGRESARELGAEIITKAITVSVPEATEKGKCSLSIDRREIKTETEGLERPKKIPKLEEDDKDVMNGSLGFHPEDCHTHMPETSEENTPETLGCKVAEGLARPLRYKKRKIVLFVAYCGVGYQGMQRNPGAVTIEGELEKALFKAGAIAECNFGDPQKVDWTRAARTDKGVSAVGQIVCGRFFIDPPGFLERVNSHLPGNIRVLGFKRVINTFNARKMCDRRRYEYVLPVFAFDPSAHSCRESLKVLEPVENVIRSNEDREEKAGENGDVKKDIIDVVDNLEHASTNIPQRIERGDGANILEICGEILDTKNTKDGVVVDHSTKFIAPSMEEITPQHNSCNIAPQTEESCSMDQSLESESRLRNTPKTSEFEFGDKQIALLNNVLSHYVGTHNFHNFTSRTKAEDPSAIRYILSFEANVFKIGPMDFVSCKVVGQSFMLHQIRKMIGLAVAIMRGCTPVSTIETALNRNVKFNVPMAPELGLVLDECIFTAYDTKFSSSHEKLSQTDFEKEIREFKWKQVYSHVASTEERDGIVALWLHSLNDRNFPDFVLERQKMK